MVGGYDNDSPFLGLALKLGSNGQVQWAKTYNISGAASKFFSVKLTTAGMPSPGNSIPASATTTATMPGW